jgi:hypothetical protein
LSERVSTNFVVTAMAKQGSAIISDAAVWVTPRRRRNTPRPPPGWPRCGTAPHGGGWTRPPPDSPPWRHLTPMLHTAGSSPPPPYMRPGASPSGRRDPTSKPQAYPDHPGTDRLLTQAAETFAVLGAVRAESRVGHLLADRS